MKKFSSVVGKPFLSPVVLQKKNFSLMHLIVARSLILMYLLIVSTSQMSLPSEVCSKGEVFMKCGMRCEPTCTDPVPDCDEECVDNVCLCEKGLIRREVGGPCINTTSCPPSQIISHDDSCSDVECFEKTHCELVDLPCSNGNCFQKAVCVDDEFE
ncbi:hypothetical protein KIN20_001514 [Parelaphostrongylus tenuis]|uniref:TIL domain-containing protein n=1 Tax=Parelaphostrongylus tenuis TaxID=148309 RepID=A0AAD5LX32_PARTN|nr:hypothetical protein KIN20_001514 [Parelaphostrongylus tenuis]